MMPASQPIAALLAASASHKLMHAFYHLGLAGLVFISTVDSSFVPLPIPGVTDILVILYAANHANLILLVFLATLGSALGGFLSHWAAPGRRHGLPRKARPQALSSTPFATGSRHHSILSVALPAILPPPMPLSPFVLVAGAIKMDRRKFMTAFTISRFVRHVHRRLARRPLRQGLPPSLEPVLRALGRHHPHHLLVRHHPLHRHRHLEARPDLPHR